MSDHILITILITMGAAVVCVVVIGFMLLVAEALVG